MSQDFNGIQNGNARDDIREAITALGLNFRLMTQFTSFVAVEEMTVTDAGVPRRIEVPVEMPEGVSHRGVFGEPQAADELRMRGRTFSNASAETVSIQGGQAPIAPKKMPPAPSRRNGGMGSGTGAGAGKGYNMGGGSPRLGGGSGTNAETGSRRPAQEPSPEERQRQALLARMHPAIAALIDRLKKNVSTPAADESKFVRNGKAEVQVWLTDKSPETLSQLKRLGFEIVLEPKSQKLIIGRITIEKLSELVNLP